MRKEINIENDRLLMHGLRDRDLAALTAMREDARVYRYEPTFLAELQGTPEEALQTIQRMDLEADRQCILGIYEKDAPDVLAGLFELYDFKPTGTVVSFGCRLRPEYWGKGLASSCVLAMIDYLRSNTQIVLITAHAIPENKASGSNLKKNGFQYLLTKTEDWGLGQPTVSDVYTYDCAPKQSGGEQESAGR